MFENGNFLHQDSTSEILAELKVTENGFEVRNESSYIVGGTSAFCENALIPNPTIYLLSI